MAAVVGIISRHGKIELCHKNYPNKTKVVQDRVLQVLRWLWHMCIKAFRRRAIHNSRHKLFQFISNVMSVICTTNKLMSKAVLSLILHCLVFRY